MKKRIECWLIMSEGVVQDSRPTEKEALEVAEQWYEGSIKRYVAYDPRVEAVLKAAEYIAKYIDNGHICVQQEPAIRKLVAAVKRYQK